MNRRLLVYGEGGSGKSTQAAKAAQWVHDKLNLKTRVVNLDGGGTLSAFEHLVDAGIASIWNADEWSETDKTSVFDVLDRATKGYWPSDLQVPGSPLEETFTVRRQCLTCKARLPVTPPAACPQCKVSFGPGAVLPLVKENLAGVGLCVFEGLTAVGEALLRRLRQVDPGGGNSVTDNSFKVSSPGQHHYLAAQSYTSQFVGNSRRLPVPLVLWTALELKGDDDGKPVYGPAGPGKKLTTTCIPWFTDVVHLDMLQKRVNNIPQKDPNGLEILERKFFLAPHYPADNLTQRWAAKTSAPLGGGVPPVMDADMEQLLNKLEAAPKNLTKAIDNGQRPT